MKIDFDRPKSATNAHDRGLPFERAADFEWTDAVIIEDARNLYPEPRFVAVGYLDNRITRPVLYATRRRYSGHQLS